MYTPEFTECVAYGQMCLSWNSSLQTDDWRVVVSFCHYGPKYVRKHSSILSIRTQQRIKPDPKAKRAPTVYWHIFYLDFQVISKIYKSLKKKFLVCLLCQRSFQILHKPANALKRLCANRPTDKNNNNHCVKSSWVLAGWLAWGRALVPSHTLCTALKQAA